MSPDIILHIQPGFQVPGHPRCFSGTPFAIKVQRVLQYKHLPFRVREVGWQERLQVLPMLATSGKLPVLDYDGERIEDSTAMAYWLEARHPEPPLVPADDCERARMHFMEEWADEVLYFYGFYGNLRLGGHTTLRYVSEDFSAEFLAQLEAGVRQHWEQTLHYQGLGRYPVEKFQADLARSLDGLEAMIARDGFTAGSRLTLADLAVFGQMARFLSGTHPWFEGEFNRRRALTGWFKRVDDSTRAADRQPSSAPERFDA
jgi:glutathione S-transferase